MASRPEIGRLHVITDETLQTRYSHVELAQFAADGGADRVQYREKRPHTTRQWVEKLRSESTRAQELVVQRTYRTWLAYLAAASVAFSEGWIDLYQTVAARRGRKAPPASPTTRAPLYAESTARPAARKA